MSYQFQIDGRPDFSFLTVKLPAGRMIKVEASAMATMSPNMVMKTKLRGGFTRLLAGENIFLNEFTSQNVPGEIGIAPGPPGDLEHVLLDGSRGMILQSAAFLACGPDVQVETKFQGIMKGFFSGESLFLVRCSGRGDLWFNTYGAMFPVDVNGSFIVDTGYIVAFQEGLQYDVTRVGGYKSLFLSGEGLVCRFSGQGRVWVQTRQLNAFRAWVHPFRPTKKSN